MTAACCDNTVFHSAECVASVRSLMTEPVPFRTELVMRWSIGLRLCQLAPLKSSVRCRPTSAESAVFTPATANGVDAYVIVPDRYFTPDCASFGPNTAPSRAAFLFMSALFPPWYILV